MNAATMSKFGSTADLEFEPIESVGSTLGNMRAAVWMRYGGPEVVQVREVARPSPGDDEVMIQVRATTVSAGDCEARSLRVARWLRPLLRVYVGLDRPRRVRVLGQELAGSVVAVGRNVTSFGTGDEVLASTGMRMGAHAEYVCLPASGAVARKPPSMTSEEAAAVPLGGLEAVRLLRDAAISLGAQVVVVGAGGSIGTIAVQVAKHFGAEVTAVDHGDKLAMLRSIGADHTVDHTVQDVADGSGRFDVIVDLVQAIPADRALAVLEPGGTYVSAHQGLSSIVGRPRTARSHGRRVTFGAASRGAHDLEFLVALAEAGELRSIIDRTYDLDHIVEAQRYVETGRKQGSVVLTVSRDRDDHGGPRREDHSDAMAARPAA